MFINIDIPKVKLEPKFAVVTRGDLVGKYQGQTARNISTLIQKYIGGVIMIDEAYSLTSGSHDDFGKEALTEINNIMSRYPDKVIFIFAGYRNQIEDGILKSQPGLARRFNWSLEITEYTAEEIFNIFMRQLNEFNLTVSSGDKDKILKFFENNKSKFPHFGGDTKVFINFIRDVCYQKYWEIAIDSNFNSDNLKDEIETITYEHVQKAFKCYIDNSVSELTNDTELPPMYM